jgi:hypothetical protein
MAALAGCRSDNLIPSAADTTPFDGEYILKPDASFKKLRQKLETETDPKCRAQGEAVLAMMASQYANFRIRHGVIRSGAQLVQEFSLREAKIEGGTLRGKAVWHEDIGDPGDNSEVGVQLRLTGDVLQFSILNETGQQEDVVELIKKNRSQ